MAEEVHGMIQERNGVNSLLLQYEPRMAIQMATNAQNPTATRSKGTFHEWEERNHSHRQHRKKYLLLDYSHMF